MSKPFTGKVGAWPHWTTPEHFIARVRQVNVIGFDPCGSAASKVGARLSLSSNGLEASWKDKAKSHLTYVNPPYNPMKPWVEKMVEEANKGVEILALVASKTGSLWWHKLIQNGDAGCFWRGRISFDNPPPGQLKPAPSVDSFVWYVGPNRDKFLDAFEDAGEIIRLQTQKFARKADEVTRPKARRGKAAAGGKVEEKLP